MSLPLSYIAAGCQQVAFVVEDITAAENFFCEKLGVTRFCRFNNFQVDDGMYRGKPAEFDYHLSIAFAADMQIELIQHLSGDNIYKEFLDTKGEGVHHLGFLLDDHQKVVKDFATNGFSIVQGGKVGGSDFAYFDTRKEIGVYLETIVLDEEGKEMFAKIKRDEF